MKLKKIISLLVCLCLGVVIAFSAAACDLHGGTISSGIEADPTFSGDNSDYINNVEYIETEENANLEEAYARTVRSVVTVSVELSGLQPQTGTGFIVDAGSGIIVTSSSLFSDDSVKLAGYDCSVMLYDGTTISATLLGADAVSVSGKSILAEAADFRLFAPSRTLANSDIALVRLDGVESGIYSAAAGTQTRIPDAVSFRDSDSLEYGEPCYTIATLAHEEDVLTGIMSEGIVTKPYNKHESSFYTQVRSFGGRYETVSFFDGSFEYLIQTGVPVNSGNQGAPLFDADGNVVGMLNLRANDTYVYSENAPFGIAFATPSETLNAILQQQGITVFYRQENVLRESCILNSADLRQASDAVAQMLMSESSDYFVVDESSEVVFRADDGDSAAETAARRVAENMLDRTVKIIAYAELGGEQFLAEGSGFLIDREGYVMTNLHVINAMSEQNQEEDGVANTVVVLADSVYCLFERGTDAEERFVVMPMEIIAYHQQGDLAILRFKNPILHEGGAESGISGYENGFAEACTFEQNVPRAGAALVALGNAFGYGVSVSYGVVSIPEFASYYSLYGYNMIQTDCPINSGNSGGALFNANGNVVGVNTLGFGGVGYDNISWAIPSAFAVDFVESVNSGVASGNVHITEAGQGVQISLQ